MWTSNVKQTKLIPDKITVHLIKRRQFVTRPTSSTVSSFSDTEYFAILSIMPLEVVIMGVLVLVVMIVVVVIMTVVMVVHYGQGNFDHTLVVVVVDIL